MCGIAGIYHYNNPTPVTESTLEKMRDTMIHRGPDGADNWIGSQGRVGLAHRRLSIIDLSTTATQPMTNEDATVWITFNGEIYNHTGLRQELIAHNHLFRTDHSDTEVIVHGYEQWGITGLLERIEGDYAIAIWDTKKENLYLARDRVGVKPLYFSLQDGRIVFASEIKAILAHPDMEADIDPMAMYHYLTFLTTPAPFTMFKGIFKLPAGHFLEIDKKGQFTSTRYWDAVPGKGFDKKETAKLSDSAREDFYIQEIRERLHGAVEKRMMSDVPFGVFLSGGIDSSTNVALMSQHMNRPVDTFTVGFKDHKHLNELEEANLVAKRFQTNHHQILIDETDMKNYLEELIHHQDEPIADWVCIPLYFVSKLAKDAGVTVVQVGEGADEQFCGYATYMGYLEMYRKYWQPFRNYLPGIAQRAVAAMAQGVANKKQSLDVYADIIERASKNREHFWSGATVFWNTSKRRLINPYSICPSTIPPELIESGLMPAEYLHADTFNIIQSFNQELEKTSPDHDILARMTYNEFKLRLPELLLMRVDKIAMSVSLEARVPFLDHHLVEFTMDIPMQDKIRGNTPKHLLKKAVEGLIPDEIIYRKKMGFGAPMAQWLRGDFGKIVQERVLGSGLLKREFFNRDYIQSLFNQHAMGASDYSLYIWTLFNLTAWYDYWIDKKAG